MRGWCLVVRGYGHEGLSEGLVLVVRGYEHEGLSAGAGGEGLWARGAQ